MARHIGRNVRKSLFRNDKMTYFGKQNPSYFSAFTNLVKIEILPRFENNMIGYSVPQTALLALVTVIILTFIIRG